jgi:hypothetical protein
VPIVASRSVFVLRPGPDQRLLTDQYARSFWVLADPEGNEACICTWLDRD